MIWSLCAALARGECKGALAAGVNAMLSPETAIKICQLRVRLKPSHTTSQSYPCSSKDYSASCSCKDQLQRGRSF